MPATAKYRVRDAAYLDQLSISQQLAESIEFELEQSYALQAKKCSNGAPYIFFVDGSGRPRVVQGCCNSWLCERCGQIRARHEYGRIVEGARQLSEAGHLLYFWTLTCRGRDMPLADAMRDYLCWTNKLLTYARRDCKQQGGHWAYAQVTERQDRQHPHSHLIVSFIHNDTLPTTITHNGKEREVGASVRFDKINAAAGLGRMYELSHIRNPIAVAVYVSKYLFKDSITTEWPRSWRRVRYSRSWPKLEREPAEVAYPLIKIADWRRMSYEYPVIYADSQVTLEAAYARLITNVVFREREEVQNVL